MWIRLVLVLACVLPGCLAENGEDPVGPPVGQEAPQVPPAFNLTFAAAGCDEITIVVPVEFSHAQQFLPDGFTPADITGLLGLPFEAGRGAVLLTNVVCASADQGIGTYEEGAVGIFIEAPSFPGEGAADYNFYEPGLATGPGPLRSALASIGWTLIGDAARSNVGDLPVVTSVGGVTDNGTVLYSASATGPAAGPDLAGSFRWWHATANGTGFANYVFGTPGYFGHSECNVSESSLPGEVAGIGSCLGSGAVIAVARDFGFAFRLAWYPGVSVA